jgi:DNA-3-methyladenine glycosylase
MALTKTRSSLPAAGARPAGPPLSRSFYNASASKVARNLLGCLLVHRPGGNGRQLIGRIVETEAYVGERDRACHAHAGPTPRNAVMYGPPGHAYVYFIYGMYDMLNVVCRPEGVPEAVLIRALEPLEGVETMRRRRRVRLDTHLTSGPGKLCRAFGLTRRLHDGMDLTGGVLWIASGPRQRGEAIARGPRIGVAYAGADALRALRFWLDGNPHVSSPQAPRHP